MSLRASFALPSPSGALPRRLSPCSSLGPAHVPLTKAFRRGVSVSCSSSDDNSSHSVLSSIPSDKDAVLKAQALGRSYGSAPPPDPKDHPAWTDQVLPSLLDNKLKIYCNRALNMRQIQAVGFDMDYTLAQYRPETFEALAHQETVDKLVNYFGYPNILKKLKFSCAYMMKGLIIDKKRGSVLKVDRHRYVKVAYHGFTQLNNQQRQAIYNKNAQQDLTFDEPDYGMVDTLFSLAEAYLFMQLVEMKDEKQDPVFASKSYADLYRELRAAVDMCHRDGSLKKAVAADPEKFIHKDPLLPHMLETLHKSGRKVFLATNSLWDFTNVVMNYLLSDQRGANKTHDWLDYFDVVMVGCGKPKFFSSKGQLFSVNIETGYLQNTDNGAPICPVDDDADLMNLSPRQSSDSSASSSNGNGTGNSPQERVKGGSRSMVFQGGCYKDLHRMLDIESGDQILYVGDHIYGDIVKSKKTIGWRTMLVLPELEHELNVRYKSVRVYEELQLLRKQRDLMDDQIQRYEWALKHGSVPEEPEAYSQNLRLLEDLRARRVSLKARHSKLLADHHAHFHPVWGQLLKAGHQNSRFAHQLERFACLYTSHVSNLAFTSPDKSFMGRMDYMAHEDFSNDTFNEQYGLHGP